MLRSTTDASSFDTLEPSHLQTLYAASAAELTLARQLIIGAVILAGVVAGAVIGVCI